MKKNLMLLLIGVACISCLDSITYEDDTIFISKGSCFLNITNRSDITVYYFIVEQNFAAYIEWRPSISAPNILSRNTAMVKYAAIVGLGNQAIRKGTKAIFYYWFTSDNNKFSVNNIVIDL